MKKTREVCVIMHLGCRESLVCSLYLGYNNLFGVRNTQLPQRKGYFVPTFRSWKRYTLLNIISVDGDGCLITKSLLNHEVESELKNSISR